MVQVKSNEKDIGSKHDAEFMIRSWFDENMAIPAVWIQPMASIGREIRTFIQCWRDRNDTAALGKSLQFFRG